MIIAARCAHVTFFRTLISLKWQIRGKGCQREVSIGDFPAFQELKFLVIFWKFKIAWLKTSFQRTKRYFESPSVLITKILSQVGDTLGNDNVLPCRASIEMLHSTLPSPWIRKIRSKLTVIRFLLWHWYRVTNDVHDTYIFISVGQHQKQHVRSVLFVTKSIVITFTLTQSVRSLAGMSEFFSTNFSHHARKILWS